MKIFVQKVVAITLMILFFGCEKLKSGGEIVDVVLNKKELILTKGDSHLLIATVIPKEAKYMDLIWDSKNAKVAVVNEEGLVEAIEVGRTKITVITEKGNKKDECIVIVKSAGVVKE